MSYGPFPHAKPGSRYRIGKRGPSAPHLGLSELLEKLSRLAQAAWALELSLNLTI